MAVCAFLTREEIKAIKYASVRIRTAIKRRGINTQNTDVNHVLTLDSLLNKINGQKQLL